MSWLNTIVNADVIGAEGLAKLDMSKPYWLLQGRMENELAKIKDNSIDCVLWDGPYGFGFMGKEWDNFKPEKISEYFDKNLKHSKKSGNHNAMIAGKYDQAINGNQKFQQWFFEQASHVYRVMKPDAYLASFGGPRTYHRMTCGIEDAGFEIRDCLKWVFASGFPKSHNGKWGGTALKPAYEPIVIARKPLIGTVEANYNDLHTGENNLMKAIAYKFGLPWPIPKEIKMADNEILEQEHRDIILKKDLSKVMSPIIAKVGFLQAFEFLTNLKLG